MGSALLGSLQIYVCLFNGLFGYSRTFSSICQNSLLFRSGPTSVAPILSANQKAQTVDVAAPGSAILSTYIGGSGDGYHTLSGTSMATPCVAGAVALLWSALGGVLLASPQDAGDVALLSATRERWLEGHITC